MKISNTCIFSADFIGGCDVITIATWLCKSNDAISKRCSSISPIFHILDRIISLENTRIETWVDAGVQAPDFTVGNRCNPPLFDVACEK